ncbi:MAG: DNA primase [Polyangiaceae bacterium]
MWQSESGDWTQIRNEASGQAEALRLIAQETIDAVRQRVSIVTVIGERMKLERRGQSHVGLCPFHKEKSPSFHVNIERGFFYCFGCKATGNVIGFVQQLDGLTFPEAVRVIAERAGIEIVETGSAIERKQEAEERRRREELYEANLAAADFYERCLTQHPLASYAWAELGRRELSRSDPTMAAALGAFKVGYAPHGWDELATHLRGAGVSRRAAEAVGLLVQRKSGDGYYDRFRHRLMFAVMDLAGKVIAFSGRSLEEPPAEQAAKDAAAQKPAKYINSPESPIYRKRDAVFGLYQARQAVREQDRCVVVEGNFDVVSLHARGICNVVAPLGTAFTPDQAGQIARYSRNAVFVFDGDLAGQKAIAASREPCQHAGLTARAARLPDGTDPDDLIRKHGREAVERLLGGAQPLLEYLIDASLRTGFSSDDAQARAAKIKEVEELIKAETDPTLRSMAANFADSVAGRLGISDVRTFRALKAAVSSAAQGGPKPRSDARPAAAPEQARSPQRIEHIAHQVLGAVLEYPELLGDAEVVPLLAVAEGDLAMALMQVQQLGSDLGRLEPAAYAARFPPSLRDQVIQRLAAPELPELRQGRSVLLENLLKLRRLQQRREQPAVVEELRRAQQSGDHEAQMNLLRLQQARTRARHGLD